MHTEKYIETVSWYVNTQLDRIIPARRKLKVPVANISEAIKKTNKCLRYIKGSPRSTFNFLNSGQYATFLYYLGHSLHCDTGDENLATRIFLLNKAVNGIDLFFEIKMPNVFLISHTVGMVFAKATYHDYAVFHQNCTVGRNQGDRPTLEKGVIMYPNSSIIGRCRVRENTVISPGVSLINFDSPGNVIVFEGRGKRPLFKETKEYYASRYFDIKKNES